MRRHRAGLDAMKGQHVRLADVFALGPAMAIGGAKLLGQSRALGALLASAGILTIAYNGANYLRARRHGRA